MQNDADLTPAPPRVAKQYIIVRHKYPDGNGGMRKIRTGKLISQGAHASLSAYKIGLRLYQSTEKMGDTRVRAFINWDRGMFTKITLYVESEEQLVSLHQQAVSTGLIVSDIIEDAGLTEFNGVPTKTAIAIGPCWEDEAQPITGLLPLL